MHPFVTELCAIIKISSHVYCDAGLGGFVACRALSENNDDPTKASRPWDSVISHHLTTSYPFYFNILLLFLLNLDY